MISLNKKFLVLSLLGYLYVPIMIFMVTWIKPIYAVLAVAAISYGFYRFYLSSFKGNEEDSLQMGIPVFCSILLFLLVVSYYAGWGNFTEQALDWPKHNSVINDLMNHHWPVYYENNGENSMLTYYLGQYIVPSVIGKFVHSFRIAELSLGLWNYLGLVIISLNLIRVLQLKSACIQFLSAFLLCFFSCPLLLARLIECLFDSSCSWIGDWFVLKDDIKLQYSDDFAMLSWVFPQAIGAWIIMLLFVEFKDNFEHYIFLFVPGVFFSTLPFLGLLFILLPYFVYFMIKNKTHFMDCLKNTLSLQNLFLFLTVGIIFILYFYGNVLSDKPHSLGLATISYNGHWHYYFVFVSIMVLVYWLCLLKDNSNNPIFYIVGINLIFIPLFTMGFWNDWGMRVSIPGLFLLMLWIIEFFDKNKFRFRKPQFCILAIFLLFGLYSSFNEFYAVFKSDKLCVRETANSAGTLEIYASRKSDNRYDLVYNYFSYDIENNLFYKYIAKKKIQEYNVK